MRPAPKRCALAASAARGGPWLIGAALMGAPWVRTEGSSCRSRTSPARPSRATGSTCERGPCQPGRHSLVWRFLSIARPAREAGRGWFGAGRFGAGVAAWCAGGGSGGGGGFEGRGTSRTSSPRRQCRARSQGTRPSRAAHTPAERCTDVRLDGHAAAQFQASATVQCEARAGVGGRLRSGRQRPHLCLVVREKSGAPRLGASLCDQPTQSRCAAQPNRSARAPQSLRPR
jgi:hypothetical protein